MLAYFITQDGGEVVLDDADAHEIDTADPDEVGALAAEVELMVAPSEEQMKRFRPPS